MTDVTMADCQLPSALSNLRDASSPAQRLDALRIIKNEIVGDRWKKKSYTQAGLLDILATITQQSETTPEAEDIRFQTLSILSSLAHGGKRVNMLLRLPGLPILLHNIDPAIHSPRIVTVALQSLCNMVHATLYMATQSKPNLLLIADSLFVEPHIVNLGKILMSQGTSFEVRNQIPLVISLIALLCREERHQVILCNSNILSSLVHRLSGIIMLQGMVPPDSEFYRQDHDHICVAQDTSELAVLLDAISAIVTNSPHRASRLLNNTALGLIFSSSKEARATYHSAMDWQSYTTADTNNRRTTINPIELLLPDIPYTPTSASTSRFPPIAGDKDDSYPSKDSSTTGSGTATPTKPSEETESPFVTYLVWLIINYQKMEMLMAVNLLVALFRVGLVNRSREQLIGCVVIPILVQSFVTFSPAKDITSDGYQKLALLQMMERATHILAQLILDNAYFQKKAVDAVPDGLILGICIMLKKSYDPVRKDPDLEPWSPSPIANGGSEMSAEDETTMDPLLLHNTRWREAALEAIASLVSLKDEYRKAIIEQGVMPHILESLRPYPEKPTSSTADRKKGNSQANPTPRVSSPEYGTNPVPVLIAACDTIRYLSRSVTLLRTTLKDFGVANPIFDLLQYPDIDVQTAATGAVANLIMEFSPMREDILSAGALRVLCEHAHSEHQKLRLNSLWALKHLVVKADNDTKKTCLEQLGQDWLVQLIKADLSHEATPVDTQQHTDDAMQIDDAEIPLSAVPDFPIDQTRDQDETTPDAKTHKATMQVQEQGLEFIRNLICSTMTPGTSSTHEASEMVDFLFNALGRTTLFSILISKLRPSTSAIPTPIEIIKPIANILVHIAASELRHRQLLIEERELMELVGGYLAHEDASVRVAFCWFIINLTSGYGNEERRERVGAEVLVECGVLERLEVCMGDADLDVRERAKVAHFQVREAVK